MNKPEEFIKSKTRIGTNTINGWHRKGVFIPSYSLPWLTPEDARKAVEIAREEIINKLRKWVSSKNERDSFTFGYIDRHFDELLKQVIKDE